MLKMLLVWSLGCLMDRFKIDLLDDVDGCFFVFFDELDGVVLVVVKDDDGNDVIMCGNCVRFKIVGEVIFGDVMDFDFVVWGWIVVVVVRDWRWWLCFVKVGNM